MNESGLNNEQEYLYWQVFATMKELFGNAITDDFDTFVKRLDETVKEKIYASPEKQ